MYAYDMQRLRRDELIRRAEAYRLAAEFRAAPRRRKSRRAARRSAGRDPEGRVSAQRHDGGLARAA